MDGIDLSQLGLGGGIMGAIALVIVTLIKARSADKQSILGQQSTHMDRLSKERNDAIIERDKAYDDVEGWRTRYEAEIRARIQAVAAAEAAQAATSGLQRQVEELTQQVVALQGQVQHLTALATPGGTP